MFTIVSVLFELVIGLAMALAMHAAFKGQGILRTVVLVPWAVLTVVTAITWQTIFEPELGFVNTLLGAVGLPDDTVWLGEEPQALIVMIFADVWKTAPFMALLMLAGLQMIPGEIYEAAKVDGATAWQRFEDHAAAAHAGDPRRADLPHARRAADLRPSVRAHEGRARDQTLSLISYQTFQQNRLVGEGSALAVLTFIIVMAVSFLYIRFIGGNLAAMAEE